MSGSTTRPSTSSAAPGYDRIRFVKPVFLGDTITVSAAIVALGNHHRQPERLGTVDELVTVTNQHTETVLVLTHLYVVSKHPDTTDGAR